MDDVAREDLAHFVKHLLEESQHGVVPQTHNTDLIQIFLLLAMHHVHERVVVAAEKVRMAHDDFPRMPRNLNFRNDADVPLRRIGYDFAELFFCVVVRSVCSNVRITDPTVPIRHRTRRTLRHQLGMPIKGNAPTMRIDEMPMEHVELA